MAVGCSTTLGSQRIGQEWTNGRTPNLGEAKLPNEVERRLETTVGQDREDVKLQGNIGHEMYPRVIETLADVLERHSFKNVGSDFSTVQTQKLRGEDEEKVIYWSNGKAQF